MDKISPDQKKRNSYLLDEIRFWVDLWKRIKAYSCKFHRNAQERFENSTHYKYYIDQSGVCKFGACEFCLVTKKECGIHYLKMVDVVNSLKDMVSFLLDLLPSDLKRFQIEKMKLEFL